ncbi:unnamed protein product [Prunus armeniaca]
MKDIFSKKSDGYSFGVLLLEFLSGKKNTVFLSSTALSLIELAKRLTLHQNLNDLQAWELWKQGDSVELRDNSMASCPKEEVSKFIHVGLLCVQEHAADRPTISEVISMLTSDHVFA